MKVEAVAPWLRNLDFFPVFQKVEQLSFSFQAYQEVNFLIFLSVGILRTKDFQKQV